MKPYDPVSTYRLQFNRHFTFRHLEDLTGYFDELGIRTIYASPVFSAVPGSRHGYDITDPLSINPEIGGLADLKKVSHLLQEKRIGWLQDIVPNHMAFHMSNEWLCSVLESGMRSPFYSYFDIWPAQGGKLMAPFLSGTLSENITAEKIQIEYDESRLVLNYSDNRFPLNAGSYALILGGWKRMPARIEKLVDRISAAAAAENPETYRQQWQSCLKELQELVSQAEGKQWLDERIGKANRDLIPQVAQMQHYWLCPWQEANRHINYRRFFAVNGLISLNMQDKKVFDHFHRLIVQLVEENVFKGLRVDHVDGLYDPVEYLGRLRNEVAGNMIYLSIEKILEADELLPHWPIEGTTGYDFLTLVNKLFSNPRGEKLLTRFYKKQIPGYAAPQDELPGSKTRFLEQYMSGDLNRLLKVFLQAAKGSWLTGIGHDDMLKAITAFIAYCPVYRFYGNAIPLPGEEAELITEILKCAAQDNRAIVPALGVIRTMLLDAAAYAEDKDRTAALLFYHKYMQLTGPAMAKGMEDTLMYAYNRLIAHNEVGDTPFFFSLPPAAFHLAMKERQQHWPHTQNTTTTHDSKRGEDARARISVLSDIPEEWIAAVKDWRDINAGLKTNGAPDFNDEYFMYQSLIGSYPLMEDQAQGFGDRLTGYIQKALREEKLHSDWQNPNVAYEESCKRFALGLLDPGHEFFASFREFLEGIADFGIMKSLGQLVLKCTCPGIPDFYQGTECWDLSFVDPDNRRAVDFTFRESLLAEFRLKHRDGGFIRELWMSRYKGGIKCWLMQLLLKLRNHQPDLFRQGAYIPLKTQGAFAHELLAFARRLKKDFVIVLVPLYLAALCREQSCDIFSIDWKDIVVEFPDDLTGLAGNLLLGRDIQIGGAMPVRELFDEFPLAVYCST